jgi:thioredoxin reductase/NAD-dependent dihydropyrimidine dehydrogenase PreA subunit
MNVPDVQYVEGVERRPRLDRRLESSVPGLHIVGAVSGSPLLKTCVNEGVEVIRSLRRIMPPMGNQDRPDGLYDIIIIGAGPAGLSAAIEAKRRGYRYLVLELHRPLNTLINFPAGKKIYAEPATLRVQGALDFEDTTKEELLAIWGDQLESLEMRCGVDVERIKREDDHFSISGKEGDRFQARRVVVAIGRMGNPRLLGVPGEDGPHVHSALLNPGLYQDREILVIGGGNSAAEAALALANKNKVVLVHRGDQLHRVGAKSRSALSAYEKTGQLRILPEANVTAFTDTTANVEQRGETVSLPCDLAFVLIGTDPPLSWLKRNKIKLEGEWHWPMVPQFLWVLALVWAIYAIKAGRWPAHGVYSWLQSVGADPGMLYGLVYSVLMTVFGFKALKRYEPDRMQQRRYGTLIASQWLIYFILPWALYYIGYAGWWRLWGVTLTYPLGYYGLFEPARELFSGTALPWAIATLLSWLVVMPLISYRHGKRFCAWVCPCGGIAESVGDQWRTKAPRGQLIRRFESSATVILVATVICSIFLISDYRGFIDPGAIKEGYRLSVDYLLASVVAITFYPFFGPRIWCRFFCPLAKWMELWARWTDGGPSIAANDECISCGECTRNCQMGIDVRAFAQRGQDFSNRTTCCVFCGICVSVCPVDVLKVKEHHRDD